MIVLHNSTTREWKRSEEGKRIEDIEIEKYVGEKGEEK